VLAGPVAVVAGAAADQVDEAVEGVLDVAAEHVEVGHQRLRVDVVGVRRGRRTRGVEVGALRALEHLRHRQAGGGLGVGGVGVDELLVLRDRPVDVAVAERVLGSGVARVHGGLAVLTRLPDTQRLGFVGYGRWTRQVIEATSHGEVKRRRKTPDRVNAEALFGTRFDLVEQFDYELTMPQVDAIAADLERGAERKVVMTSPEGESLILQFGGIYAKASAAMLAACREVKFGTLETAKQ